VTGGALFYMTGSVLAIGAFFLLVDFIERGREVGADVLAVSREAFGGPEEERPEEEAEVGVAIPGTVALLGAAFMACALLLAGLATVIAMLRAGIDVFWASPPGTAPRIAVVEIGPVGLLLLLCLALTVAAGPAMDYMQAAAAALHAPQGYLRGVMAGAGGG
jgi:multicomponent K+:H+ antiporter subunit D